MSSQIAYSIIIKLGSQRIIVYTSMNKAQADLVHDAIERNVQSRAIAGHIQQPSPTQ